MLKYLNILFIKYKFLFGIIYSIIFFQTLFIYSNFSFYNSLFDSNSQFTQPNPGELITFTVKVDFDLKKNELNTNKFKKLENSISELNKSNISTNKIYRFLTVHNSVLYCSEKLITSFIPRSPPIDNC
jgi:hypothetical protein